MRNGIWAALAAASVIVAAPVQAAESATLDEVLANPRRAQDAPRDQYRHPKETLEFFQVEPGMTVVDYLPAGGWYTRILVPFLGPDGRYVAMGPDVTGGSEYMQRTAADMAGRFAAKAEAWNLGEGAAISGYNTGDQIPVDLQGSVDRVLIFREMHNVLRTGTLHDDMLAIRRLLKPDGMIGITDHRMFEDAPYAMSDGNKGYLRQSDVIDLMDVYGFDLVGASEVNANPKDTKDWPRGVWMLPPGLSGATDETRPKMLAIGESDRMTLLFRKRP